MKLTMYTSVAAIVSVLMASALAGTTRVEELQVRLSKDRYELYEPIVVELVLRANGESTKRQETGQPPRRLIAELRQNGQKLVTAHLYGGALEICDRETGEQCATVLGIFGTNRPSGEPDGFEPWGLPGKFQVVVRDQDQSFQSEEVPIEITTAADHNSAVLFREEGLHILAMIFGFQRTDAYAQNVVTLASDPNGSVYAKYAAAGLQLRCVPGVVSTFRNSTVADCPRELGETLRAATILFPPGHPVRNRASLQLSKLMIEAGDGPTAESVLKKLDSEVRDGWHRNAVRRLLQEQSESQPAESRGH
jgi:hypothetical protein